MINESAEIFNLYRGVLLRESPDTLEENGRTYRYYDEGLHNYVGIALDGAHFVVTDKTDGHHDLKVAIHRGVNMFQSDLPPDKLKTAIAWADDMDNFRFWADFKVCSLWSPYITKKIISSIAKALRTLGYDFTEVMYEVMGVKERVSWEDLKKSYQDPADQKKATEELNRTKRQLAQDRRALADYLLRSRDGD